MSLISNLRGGQQRYMPLLMSKINETMSNAPGYSLTSMAGSSYGTEMYGESEHARSAPTSSVSSPFGTPPLSALEQSQSFGGFSQSLGFGMTTMASNFATTLVATSVSGQVDTPVSGPLQMFADPSVFQGAPAPSRYDSDD
jgi:hypothetical protein